MRACPHCKTVGTGTAEELAQHAPRCQEYRAAAARAEAAGIVRPTTEEVVAVKQKTLPLERSRRPRSTPMSVAAFLAASQMAGGGVPGVRSRKVP